MESGPWRSLRHFDSRLQGTDLGELIAVPKANMKESKKGWLAHTPFSTRGPRGEPPQSTISGPCLGTGPADSALIVVEHSVWIKANVSMRKLPSVDETNC